MSDEHENEDQKKRLDKLESNPDEENELQKLINKFKAENKTLTKLLKAINKKPKY
jgi:hypothetical protein